MHRWSSRCTRSEHRIETTYLQVTFCLHLTSGFDTPFGEHEGLLNQRNTFEMLQRLQIFLHQRKRDGAFADCRGHPMTGPEAHITRRKNAGNAGLQ